MNESLLELARTVRPGGRAVFDLREVQIGGRRVQLDRILTTLIDQNLSGYWEAEGLYVANQRAARIKDSLGSRDEIKRSRCNRMLVLRRR